MTTSAWPKPGEVYQCGECTAVVKVVACPPNKTLEDRVWVVHLNKPTPMSGDHYHKYQQQPVWLPADMFPRRFTRKLPEAEAFGYLLMEE